MLLADRGDAGGREPRGEQVEAGRVVTSTPPRIARSARTSSTSVARLQNG